MMIKVLVVVVVNLIGTRTGVATETDSDHNREKHAALCDVLGTAVTIFKSGRGGPKLQSALKNAIFGTANGGEKNALPDQLPNTHRNPGDRENWCGSCRYSSKEHYPGKSIPHDLLCLCTVGENGHPFTSGGSNTKLCGQSAKNLGCGGSSESGCSNGYGWTDSSTNGQAEGYLSAAWNNVVKQCLLKDVKTPLEKARHTLMEQLKPSDGTSAIWAKGHSYGCKGKSGEVCVSYGSWCGKEYGYPQWLEGLYEALEKADFTQTELTSKGYPNASTEEVVAGGKHVPNEVYSQGVQQDKSGAKQRSKESSNHIYYHTEVESGTIVADPPWFLIAVFFI